jgi:hypothetical protein
MMKKIKEKGRRILRTVYAGIGAGAVAFVFQACYGPPQSHGMDVFIHGFVKSKTTNSPIKGIKVSVKDGYQYELTDSAGEFQLYVHKEDVGIIQLEDIDSTENGYYLSREIFVDLSKDNIDLMDIFMSDAE